MRNPSSAHRSCFASFASFRQQHQKASSFEGKRLLPEHIHITQKHCVEPLVQCIFHRLEIGLDLLWAESLPFPQA